MSISSQARTATFGRPLDLRELLGQQLRLLRTGRDVSREVAGHRIGASPSKISRIELGRVRISAADLHMLLDLYGVTDPPQRDAILDLADRSNGRQWWHRYSDVLPDWFCSYLALESGADVIRTYEVQYIPGLLQTRAYAEAVIRQQYHDEAEIRRRLDVRMHRQRMLLRQHRPNLWAVIDEAALRREIGGGRVMQEQLEFLRQANALPNVGIQILPFDAGGRVAAGNSFTILRLPTAAVLDVVYLEQIDSALYFSRPDQVDPYIAAMSRLCVAAHQPAVTTQILEQRLRRSG